MKKDASYRNIFEVLLGVFAVSWIFFGAVIAGNKFGIFSYSGFSGKFTALMGLLTPSVAVYMFMTVWGDVSGAGHFCREIIKSDRRVSCILCTLLFAAFHVTAVIIAGKYEGYDTAFVLMLIPSCSIASGLAEICWRGFLFPALYEKMPYLIAVIFCGFINGLYYIPFWFISGSRYGEYDFPVYLLYCTFMSIILCALYRLTESVLTCIILRSVMQLLTILYAGVIFERPRSISLSMAEMAIATVLAICCGTRKKNTEAK